MVEEPEPPNEPCAICRERESMDGRDICGKCGSDANWLGPEADMLKREPDVPEWY